MVTQEEATHRSRPAPSVCGQKKPKFVAVDFFCGAGGTTRGLIDAGGYVIAGIDKSDVCRQTYVTNNQNTSWDCEFPRFLSLDLFPATSEYPAGQQEEAISILDDLISTYRSRYPNVPLLFAICAPCQPFTTLSKSTLSPSREASRSRDRNLLAHACTFVERYLPDMILSENVTGVSRTQTGRVWEVFAERLRQLNYNVATRRVCAADFGVPQYRKRLFLGAIYSDPLCKPSLISLPESDTSVGLKTVSEAFRGLPPLKAGEMHSEISNHITRNLSELNLKRISYAEPGKSNEYLASTPEGDLSLACHNRVNERHKSRCFGDVYTRMSPNKPSPTITTRCASITNGRFGHPDTTQLRGISMREAARLQSFRDDYVFHPTNKVDPVAQMIGNAVPPVLARFFADHLTKLLGRYKEARDNTEVRRA